MNSPQTLVHKAFCCAQYCFLGKCLSRRLLKSQYDPKHRVYRVVDPTELEVFEKLNLNRKMVEKLYEIFQDIDRDGSGEISHYEFFRFFRHKRFPDRSKYSKKIFKAFDLDGSGEIDFQEFVLCLWNFCSCTKESLFRLSFELYDTDRSGYIDEHEMAKILKELYGKQNYEKNAGSQHVLRKLREMDGEMNFRAFADFARKHPALLYPAFRLQSCLQQNILGLHFWEEAAAARHALEKDVAVDIMETKGKMPTGGLRYTDLIDYLNVCAKNDVTNNFAAGNMLDQSAGKEGGMLVVHRPPMSPKAEKKTPESSIDGFVPVAFRMKTPKKTTKPKKKPKSPKANRAMRKIRSVKSLAPSAVVSDHPWICKKCAQMNQASIGACYACRTPFDYIG
jgi:Ca2+-binding EF-hand superfamily protein